MLGQVTAFAAQFMPDGDGYLYRKGQRAAPVRVSAEERDAFVAGFDRAVKLSFPLLMVGMIAITIVNLLVALNVPDDYDLPLMFGGLVLVILPYCWFVLRAWNVAARAVAGRPVLGEARSAGEMQGIMLASLSYRWLGLMALLALFLLLQSRSQPGFLGAWEWVRVAMPLLLLGVVAVQGFRKWRSERG